MLLERAWQVLPSATQPNLKTGCVIACYITGGAFPFFASTMTAEVALAVARSFSSSRNRSKYPRRRVRLLRLRSLANPRVEKSPTRGQEAVKERNYDVKARKMREGVFLNNRRLFASCRGGSDAGGGFACNQGDSSAHQGAKSVVPKCFGGHRGANRHCLCC